MFGFMILLARLVELQIIKGRYYRVLAENNRIRKVPIEAPRGRIVASGGELLVGNALSKKKIEFDKTAGFKKVEVKDESGDNIIDEYVRDYYLREFFSHVGGYVGEVGKEEIGKVEGECPEKGVKRIGKKFGKTGLEKEYDCLLSGVDGEALYEVDATGENLRFLGKKDAVPGGDLKLNIDFGIQLVVSKAISDKKGSIIVSRPDGSILAIYSSPSFDPNVLISGNQSLVSQILEDENLPLFNRSVGGLFHPGSILKPIIALGALQDGSIKPDFTYEDKGVVVIKNVYGSYTFRNWLFAKYGRTEGRVDVVRAIARSTDTFFYKLGEIMGPERIYYWADRFGLTQKTGIDIPGEVVGLVPNPEWKLKNKKERWFLGDTYNISIGQGDLLVTPIALHRAISSLASGGLLCRPRLAFGEKDCEKIDLNSDFVELIKKGMEAACSDGGTAYPFYDFYEKFGVRVACKTGTAQNVNENPHAWFTAFAPSSNPEIVVTVLVEGGGEGSQVAAPIARQILDYYFGATNRK